MCARGSCGKRSSLFPLCNLMSVVVSVSSSESKLECECECELPFDDPMQ